MKNNTAKLIIFLSFLLLVPVLKAQEEKEVWSFPPPPPPPTSEHLDFEVFTKIELTEAQEKEYLKACSERVYSILNNLKKRNPDKYPYLLRKAYKQAEYQKLNSKFNKDKERLKLETDLMELEIISEALAYMHETANDKTKKSIENDLLSSLQEIFDLRESKKAEEVKMLEKRLAELKQSLTERQKYKDEIIKRRLQELIKEKDNLGWD